MKVIAAVQLPSLTSHCLISILLDSLFYCSVPQSLRFHFPLFKAKLVRNDQEGKECHKKAAFSHYKNETRQ